jgi:heptosyltransferase-3
VARLMMMRRLRAMELDDVIIATTSPQPRVIRVARWLKPKRIIGFGDAGRAGYCAAARPPKPPRSRGRVSRRVALRHRRPAAGLPGDGARRACTGRRTHHRHPHQRPQTLATLAGGSFAETIKVLAAQDSLRFMLLWSPGDSENPLHPGDDAKAREVLARVGAGTTATPAVAARPTQTLPELIGALAECDALICADGGAMHLAAGLGLPIVCLFGNSGAARWRPWGVPYRLLQKYPPDVADIGVGEVVAAFNALRADIPVPSA